CWRLRGQFRRPNRQKCRWNVYYIMSQPFVNPYGPSGDLRRIMTDVGEADYYLVKSIRPTLATITTTVGLLWKKLCYELRRQDISDYTDVERFEHFVANAVLIDADELEALRADARRGGGLRDGAVS